MTHATPHLPKAPQSERIASIDVLRGATILGILPMNIQLFAMLDAGMNNPMSYGESDPSNVLAWVFTHVVFGMRDLATFSMLFGAGIVMMSARRAAGSLARLHYRRMLVMAGLGLAHAYLIWYGDILYTFALCGMVVFRFRDMKPSAQLLTVSSEDRFDTVPSA